MEVFLLILFSVLLALIPASIAKKKGYSYGGFWLFGFFLWLPAIIVAACLSDKTRQATAYPPPPPYASPIPPPPPYIAGSAYIPPRPAVPRPQVPAEKTCAYCGTRSPADKTTCDSCGARL